MSEVQFFQIGDDGRPAFAEVVGALADRGFELYDVASLSAASSGPPAAARRRRLRQPAEPSPRRSVVGMSDPLRLTVVMTHPVQYYAPWFRHIDARCRELDLTVIYATQPTPAQQGEGFGVGFEWDVPVLDGYRCRVLRPARPSDSVRSDRFRGVDVPEIGEAIRESAPDVVLIPGWHSITLVRALGACRRARLPVLYRGDTHLGNAPARLAPHPVGGEDRALAAVLRRLPERGPAGRRVPRTLRRAPSEDLQHAPLRGQRILRRRGGASPDARRPGRGPRIARPRCG